MKRNSRDRLIERKVKDRRWLKYLITAAVLSALTVLVAWLQGAFTEVTSKTLIGYSAVEKQYRLMQWSNAFFASGTVAVCLGVLVLFKSSSLFAMLVRGLVKFFRLFKQDSVDRKYRNFAKHRKALRDKKVSYWFILIVGVLFVGISAALHGLYLLA